MPIFRTLRTWLTFSAHRQEMSKAHLGRSKRCIRHQRQNQIQKTIGTFRQCRLATMQNDISPSRQSVSDIEFEQTFVVRFNNRMIIKQIYSHHETGFHESISTRARALMIVTLRRSCYVSCNESRVALRVSVDYRFLCLATAQ